MAISPEKAMDAAKKKAAPIIKTICTKIDAALSSGDFDGVNPIVVEIPIKIENRNGPSGSLTDVHRFMVDDAVEAYRKPSESGSRWDVTIGEVERPEIVVDSGGGQSIMRKLYLLTFTPIFPSPPNPADH
jgi:hypothetical protein